MSTRITSSWCATSFTCLGRLRLQEEPARLERNHGAPFRIRGKIVSNEQGTGGGLTISPPMAATSALAGPSPSHSSAGAAAAGGGCRVPLAAVASGRASPAFSRAAIFWVLSAEVSAFGGARERPERKAQKMGCQSTDKWANVLVAHSSVA